MNYDRLIDFLVASMTLFGMFMIGLLIGATAVIFEVWTPFWHLFGN